MSRYLPNEIEELYYSMQCVRVTILGDLLQLFEQAETVLVSVKEQE